MYIENVEKASNAEKANAKLRLHSLRYQRGNANSGQVPGPSRDSRRETERGPDSKPNPPGGPQGSQQQRRHAQCGSDREGELGGW